MINPETGQRELAYIARVTAIQPLPGYDRVEYARVLNWWCVVRKGQFQVGDLGVYIEIDSLVPAVEPFLFLKEKKFKVKTQKMCKVYSQGLLMSLDDFAAAGEVPDWARNIPAPEDQNTFLTETLGITYYEPGDNERKGLGEKSNNKHNKKLFKRFRQKQMIKKSHNFPTCYPFVIKTDEERCENLPISFLNDKTPYRKTLKIDGTSATYIYDKHDNFYVCSRNKTILKPNQKGFYDGKVYWDMVEKYNLKDVLRNILKSYNRTVNRKGKLKYVAIQGEIAGMGIQKNPHSLPDVRLYIFNFIDSEVGRWDLLDAKSMLTRYNLDFVPIVEDKYILPNDFMAFKESADGDIADYLPEAKGLREGFVYRSSLNPMLSFKNVSRQYLEKKGKYLDESIE